MKGRIDGREERCSEAERGRVALCRMGVKWAVSRTASLYADEPGFRCEGKCSNTCSLA